MPRSIHPDFEEYLEFRDESLQALYHNLRSLLLQIHPDGNEILYHTHALTSVYSTSLKLKHAYCHIPIYSEHLNLGFNFGTMLNDPHNLLQGTGKTIRHVPIRSEADLALDGLQTLIEEAIGYSLESLGEEPKDKRIVLSKIKS